MSSTSPPRRFKVEPIETSSISSKDKNKEETSEAPRPVRRFAPEPIETTTASNHKKLPEPVETIEKSNRRFVPEPVEISTSTNRKTDTESHSSTKPIRRFAPEPIETSTTTNRKPPSESPSSNKPRRFAPEPLETTTKSNRKVDTDSQQPTKPTRRFAPEPIETSAKTNRKSSPESVDRTKGNSRQKFDEEWQAKPTRPPRRFKPEHIETTSGGSRLLRSALKRPKKFSPQLIETAQRSRKAGSTAPTLHPSDRTEATPDEALSIRKARILGIPPTPPVNTPTEHLSQNPLFLEIQRNCDACPLSRRRSYFSSSQHSFRVPDLDPIESSESEASTPPSPITLPYTPQDHSFLYTEATRRRESVDDRSSGYLLELAAKAAEKQLREQAMAAYPNDDYHEPVDHFVDCDMEASGSSLDNVQGRGDSSFTEVNWELKAMREFQEEQEAATKSQEDNATSQEKPCEDAKPSYNPFGNAAGFLDPATAKKIAAQSKDPEMDRMRREARPPMLGKEIRFPRCESPEPSRFDPTQGCDAVKTAMCYLSEQSKAASEKGESLWCGKGNGRQTSTTPSLWSSANSRASSTTGLWGGFCINGGDKSPRGPTGILTPHHEKANPLSPTPTPAMSLLPPTPPASSYGITADFTGIDEKLAVEQTIAEDFGDDFVTQVYNYLSLGYPSMARPFDEELSKISQFSISELRQDDHLARSRGYIRLGKDGNLSNSEITEETCMRWRALRVYIQEWARQHPQMAEDEFLLAGGRGTAVRKGSWAL